jgi:hypothetical protein
MKTPLLLLVLLTALGIHTSLAADEDKPSAPPAEGAARMRFVPGGPPAKGSSDYKGASYSALVPGPGKGVLWLQAHAGIGDTFPVRDKAGMTLFEVIVAEGDDDHLVLEVHSKEGSKKIDLARDKAGAVEVAGIKYVLSYPSISVGAAPGEKPTTNKAMLIVMRRR